MFAKSVPVTQSAVLKDYWGTNIPLNKEADAKNSFYFQYLKSDYYYYYYYFQYTGVLSYSPDSLHHLRLFGISSCNLKMAVMDILQQVNVWVVCFVKLNS